MSLYSTIHLYDVYVAVYFSTIGQICDLSTTKKAVKVRILLTFTEHKIHRAAFQSLHQLSLAPPQG